jgi:hypothetical protein
MREGRLMDSLPLWFWLPLGIVLWAWLITVTVRSISADPYPDEPTGLDVLERSGSYPHG